MAWRRNGVRARPTLPRPSGERRALAPPPPFRNPPRLADAPVALVFAGRLVERAGNGAPVPLAELFDEPALWLVQGVCRWLCAGAREGGQGGQSACVVFLGPPGAGRAGHARAATGAFLSACRERAERCLGRWMGPAPAPTGRSQDEPPTPLLLPFATAQLGLWGVKMCAAKHMSRRTRPQRARHSPDQQRILFRCPASLDLGRGVARMARAAPLALHGTCCTTLLLKGLRTPSCGLLRGLCLRYRGRGAPGNGSAARGAPERGGTDAKSDPPHRWPCKGRTGSRPIGAQPTTKARVDRRAEVGPCGEERVCAAGRSRVCFVGARNGECCTCVWGLFCLLQAGAGGLDAGSRCRGHSGRTLGLPALGRRTPACHTLTPADRPARAEDGDPEASRGSFSATWRTAAALVAPTHVGSPRPGSSPAAPVRRGCACHRAWRAQNMGLRTRPQDASRRFPSPAPHARGRRNIGGAPCGMSVRMPRAAPPPVAH